MSNAKGTAIVTGASSGIGAVYADRLAKRGHDLVLVARDTARLEALATRLRGETGVTIEVLTADLTAGDDVARVETRVAADDVTLLINNAGLSLHGGLLEEGADAFERLIALNVTAPTRLAGAAGQAFAKRGAGAIVNVASVLALAVEISEPVYSGSKAFLLALTLSHAEKAKGSGVHVQAVLPGATRTEIWERSGKDIDAFPAEMVMTAEDLVDAALLGLDRGEVVTIPPLADEAQWTAFDEARRAMTPGLSRREVGARYREAVTA